MALVVERIKALRDNYSYLIYDPASGWAAVVDPAEAEPVEEVLRAQALSPQFVFNTHHHFDHIGGNADLIRDYGCQVVAPLADRHRIHPVDRGVGDGELIQFGASRVRVMTIPGHTLGHVAYWFEPEGFLFCGDTLFSVGCGRLFEGTPEMMWASLTKLMGLPPQTQIYCGHEYTEANCRFALTVEPANVALQQRYAEVVELRRRGVPTVPSTLAEELAVNPFLRAGTSLELAGAVGLPGRSAVEIFAELRRRKDTYAS